MESEVNNTNTNTDDLDINIDAFGSDAPVAESKITVPLKEEDEQESPVLTINDVAQIVRDTMIEMGAKPSYPVRLPVGMPKPSVHEGSRKPVGQYNILEVNEKDPNMVYRWVNDVHDGQRVQRFVDAGYVPVVKPSTKAYDNRAGSDSQMGSSVIRSVGGGTKSVLMAIRRDWYEEDQRKKHERISAAERKISTPYNQTDDRVPDPQTGEYGSVRIKR